MIDICLQNYLKQKEGFVLYKWLTLPMNENSLQQVLNGIGISDNHDDSYYITGYKCEYENIIKNFGERDNLRALNKLAGELTAMDEFDCGKLDAACILRGCDNAVDVLNLAANLDSYEFIPANNDEALGEFEVECGKWNIPEEIKEIWSYIDYEKVGKDTREKQGGIFEGLGYIYSNKGEFVEKYKLEDFQEIRSSSNFIEKSLAENVAADTTALTRDEKDSLLSKRANLEYESYLEQVKLLPPDKIVDEAYKISTMYDILIQIENNDLPEPDIDALLSLERPISAIYYEWLDADLNIGDFLSFTIRDVINIQKEEIAYDNADTQELCSGNEDENEDGPEFD